MLSWHLQLGMRSRPVQVKRKLFKFNGASHWNKKTTQNQLLNLCFSSFQKHTFAGLHLEQPPAAE